MKLRHAVKQDLADILAWRNDAVTRAMSRSPEPVDAAGHNAWFTAALSDPARVLLIGELDGGKVGMVRIDRGHETEVSINLNPAFRGRGLSLDLLNAALATETGPILAVIRPNNAASIRLFEWAGFVRTGFEGGFFRYIRAGRC
jgi:RimJ/RimL family protein N-acetyltransferase